MALLIIPLGCISAKKQFYIETSDDGSAFVNPSFERVEQVKPGSGTDRDTTSLLLTIWGAVVVALAWTFFIIRAILTMIMKGYEAVRSLLGEDRGGSPPSTPAPGPGGGAQPPGSPGEPASRESLYTTAESGPRDTPAASRGEARQPQGETSPPPAGQPVPGASEKITSPAEDEDGEESIDEDASEDIGTKRRGIRLNKDLL